MKNQFISAINHSSLMKLSRNDIARMIRLHRSGSFRGVIRKTNFGYMINGRLTWAIAA